LCLLKEKYNEFFNSANPDKLFLNLENVPDLQKQYAQLRRKVVYFSKLLEYLGPQYEQARIEEAKDVPTIQVIDKAKRPEWKYKPKRALIVIFTFVFSIFIVALFIVLKKNYENINKNLN
ncbi:MAG: hypothetical protein ISS28_05040, partial [Candidatus Cloacimonetes bacterium]|nr:hypothetical protein [Candidatus Cloacimonadota bacterium]